MRKYSILDLYDDVKQFNTVAGKADGCTKEELINQLRLIEEEVSEISDGLFYNNAEEVLDGAVDTLYVLLGFIQKLEQAKFDFSRAMQITAENNLTKFPVSGKIASETQDLNPGSKIVSNLEYNRFAILNESNKVIKPVGYVKNDLAECLTEVNTKELFDGQVRFTR